MEGILSPVESFQQPQMSAALSSKSSLDLQKQKLHVGANAVQLLAVSVLLADVKKRNTLTRNKVWLTLRCADICDIHLKNCQITKPLNSAALPKGMSGSDLEGATLPWPLFSSGSHHSDICHTLGSNCASSLQLVGSCIFHRARRRGRLWSKGDREEHVAGRNRTAFRPLVDTRAGIHHVYDLR